MIKDVILQVQRMHRAALEQTYTGLCNIVEYQEVTDEKTKLSNEKEVTVLESQPCKLSFERLAAVVQTETAAIASQGIKLFLAPETMVKSGSKIAVTQDGVTSEYSTSSQPAVYCTHQEIVLELFRGWA